MSYKKIAFAAVFAWFLVGGIAHFAAPEFFLKIIPPDLPFPLQIVYLSGLFELLGALGLLHAKYRRAAATGLFLLTIAVTPANIYMWLNPSLFPLIPEFLLGLRLLVQAGLLAAIWWIRLPEVNKAA